MHIMSIHYTAQLFILNNSEVCNATNFVALLSNAFSLQFFLKTRA